MNRILTLISVVGLAVFAGGCTVTTYPARPVYYEPAPPVYYEPAPPVVVYPAPPRPVIVRPVPPPYYHRHCDRYGRCW